jgi:hypothetical protein
MTISRVRLSKWSHAACAGGLLLAVVSMAPTVRGQDRQAGRKKVGSLFQTSDRCVACHNGLTTPTGEDISIGFAWRPTMMANSGRDPYWQAGVRREILEHPESRAAIENECSICHMPMATYQMAVGGQQGFVFGHLPFDPEKEGDRLAADSVSCTLCHQITREKLGTRASLVGGFVIDREKPRGEREIYGPYAIDAGHARIMRSSSGGFQPTASEHIRQSELCATCHTLLTQALGPQGKVIGELPEQVPYQEWFHSKFKNEQSCQACHMPVVKDPVPATAVYGEPREGFSRHTFVGGNFFMQRLLSRFRADLGVTALPQELEGAALRTIEHLKTQAATVSIDSVDLRTDRLEVAVTVRNLGGHKLPTAYPSRRAWLHLTVRGRNDQIIFDSGALEPGGRIRGNDNDADPKRFEPHHQEVRDPEQVQIYEAIMADSTGAVTTGLLNAVKYVKDNRLLPMGFDKRTADKEIMVQGEADQDADFMGGSDTTRYRIAVAETAGPFQVEIELWYQPISYRWAQNLRQYDAFEPKRFVGYYEAMSQTSGIMLVRAVSRNP